MLKFGGYGCVWGLISDILPICWARRFVDLPLESLVLGKVIVRRTGYQGMFRCGERG